MGRGLFLNSRFNEFHCALHSVQTTNSWSEHIFGKIQMTCSTFFEMRIWEGKCRIGVPQKKVYRISLFCHIWRLIICKQITWIFKKYFPTFHCVDNKIVFMLWYSKITENLNPNNLFHFCWNETFKEGVLLNTVGLLHFIVWTKY